MADTALPPIDGSPGGAGTPDATWRAPGATPGRTPGRTVDASYRALPAEPSIAASKSGVNPLWQIPTHVLALTVVSLLSFIVTMAACFTPVYTITANNARVSQTPWWYTECLSTRGVERCVDTRLPVSSPCTHVIARQNSVMAFVCLSIIFSLFSVGAGVGECLGKTAKVPIAFASLFVLAWLFNFINWTMIAGTFNASLCGAPTLKAAGYKMSASWALQLCLWLTQTPAFVYYLYSHWATPEPRRAAPAETSYASAASPRR